MADCWPVRLRRYRWRARIHKGVVAIISADLRRLLDERDLFHMQACRLEDECDRLRGEVAERESRLTRHRPVWEKEAS